MNIFRELRYLAGDTCIAPEKRIIMRECKKLLDFAEENKVLRFGTEAGRYYFYWGNKLVLARENIPREIIEQVLARESLSTMEKSLACVAKWFPSKARVPEGKYVGDVIVEKGTTGYKVFDCLQDFAYEFCTCEQNKKIIDAVQHFNGKLPITYLRQEGNVMVERFVHSIPCSQWNNATIVQNYIHLLHDLETYYRNSVVVGMDTIEEDEAEILGSGNGSLIEFIGKIDRECRFRDPLPKVFCHGDLTPFNVLYDGKAQYYFDFEYAQDEDVFMDIFNFLFGWDDNGRAYILKNKDVVEALKGVFDVLGLEWNKNMLKDYVYRFLIVYFTVWVERFGGGCAVTGVPAEWEIIYRTVQECDL